MWLLWPGWNIRPALQLSEIIREFGAGKDIIWHVFSTSAILDKGCCSALGEGGPSSLCEGVSAALDKGFQYPAAHDEDSSAGLQVFFAGGDISHLDG